MDEEANGEKQPRAPTRADLARIGKSLNEHGVKYAVIGGFAVIHHGFLRTTADIDLLVDPSPENVERIRHALCVLEDCASLEVNPTDIQTYTVVRIADEVVVDLLGKACQVTLEDIEANIVVADVDGIPVRYASAADLIRLKQTVRPKDAVDRQYLEELLRSMEED